MTEFRFDDPRQNELYTRLRQIGEWPAAAFRDACQFFSPTSPVAELETAAHLAVHVQREIKSAIAQVLLPLDFKTPREAHVAGVFADIAGVFGAALTQESEQRLRDALAPFNLKKQSKGGDAATLQAILEAFDLPKDHEVAKLWEEMGKLHDKAHRRALAAPRRLEQVRQAWEVFQQLLALLLEQLDAAWILVYRRIDELVATQHPGENHISRLRNKIPNNSHTFRYFFDRAQTTEWVAAITRDSSLFTDPPAEGAWPAIQYLVQVAREHPNDVHRIAIQLPATPNVLTNMAILQIAEALPPEFAKDIVIRQAVAISEGNISDEIIARDLANAAARVREVDLDAALGCFRALLALQPLGQPHGDLVSPFDTHSYGEIITAIRPVMAGAPRQTYDMLASLLDVGLTSAYQERGDDDSNGWMPAIEPHPQNHYYKPLPHLASAVRDAAERVLEASPTALTDIVTDAEARRWYFFRRLALHLLRSQPTAPAAHDRALEQDIVQEWELKHEARLFLRAAFQHLAHDEQEQIVSEILTGPADVIKGSFATDYERDDYCERWVTRRLWWVYEWLTGDVKVRYDALIAKHGEPDEQSDFVGWIGPLWVGPTSPKPAAELADMEVPTIIEFLRAWQPTGNRFGPVSSRDGMARELQTVAAKRPADFSRTAHELIGVDATYIRGILNGLQNAVQNDHATLDWETLLDLGEWIVTQERAIHGRADDKWDDDDPHWGWARGAVGRLIEAALQSSRTRIDIVLRHRVWTILSVIAEDPDPSPEREQEYASEPLSIAINSTRGEAFQAVMEYARWVRLSTPEDERPTDFSDMPEVRSLLEDHLVRDSSIGVRAIYGQYLVLISCLDRTWLQNHLTQLFPDTQPRLRDAVWQTHIVYGRTSQTLMTMLAGEYERAIARLDEKPSYTEYYDQLTRHILWLYAGGMVSTDDGDLVDRLFRATDDETRARAVELVPGAVRDVVHDDDAAYRQTLEAFWVWCVKREDLIPAQAGFGVWFHDEKLDLEWRLVQLERALTIAGGILRDFRVMDDLADAATAHPRSVLRNARLLVNVSDPMWIHMWAVNGKLRKVITAAIEHGDTATADAARALANHLVGRGFDTFLDLAAPTTTLQ